MSMLKKLVVALVVSGEFFAGSVKGEVWKTPWTVGRDKRMQKNGQPRNSFDVFLKSNLNKKGCYIGDDWDDADAIRGAVDGNNLQMAGFAYLINNSSKPEERTPVFFGAKHPYDPNYPEKVHSSMFTTSEYDHTERQLVNACFAWHAFKGRGFFREYGLNLNNAQKPIALDLNRLKKELGNDFYTLRVHTKAVPCGDYVRNNHCVPCCEAYGHLLYDLYGANDIKLNISISYSSNDNIEAYCKASWSSPEDLALTPLPDDGHFYDNSKIKNVIDKLYARFFSCKKRITTLLDKKGEEFIGNFYECFLRTIVARAYMCDLKKTERNLSDAMIDYVDESVIKCISKLMEAQDYTGETDDERKIVKVMKKIKLKRIK